MAINFNNYLITYQLQFNKNISHEFNKISKGIEELKEGTYKKFARSFSAIGKAGAVIGIKITLKPGSNLKRLNKIKTRVNRLKKYFTEDKPNTAYWEVLRSMENVRDNVWKRFESQGFDVITGQLRNAVYTQSVEIERTGLRIKSATMNIKELNSGTPLYTIKEGEIYPRQWQYQYTYGAADKDVKITGYWGFLEFAHKYNYILNLARNIHGADRAEFANIKKEIQLKIKEFREEVSKI